MTAHLFSIRGVASGKILFDEEDLPPLLPFSWSIGSHGYAQGVGAGIACITMHKLLLGPCPGGMVTDHINRNRLDNRRTNLRFVTHHQNNMNRRVSGGGAYKLKSGRFQAKLKRNNKRIHLGTFDTMEQADLALRVWRTENDKPF
jgi:hypothetical protein